MSKILYIIRGVSGAGKSLVGESLNCIHIEIDQYFTENGKYTFNSNKLPNAIQWCFRETRNNMNTGNSIAVTNSFIREQDVEKYRTLAINKGYMPIVMTVENWHGGNNVHDVPKSSLERMEQQLKQSIKLR